MFNSLFVIGTGNAMTTKYFNTCFLLKDSGGEHLLVDTGGGNGIMRCLEDMGIDYGSIHHLFITHAHTDHILGFPWIVRSIGTRMLSGKYEGDFHVYCHAAARRAAEAICGCTVQNKFLKLFGQRIIFHTLCDKDEIDVLGTRMSFFDIHSTKAEQFGFFCDIENNKRLVCLGDEPCCPECEEIAKDCDWLLSEAFCLYKDRERFKPYEKHHSTALDAAKLAKRVNAKNLVLWHTESATFGQRRQRYTDEAKTVFDGNVFVPDDGEIIPM